MEPDAFFALDPKDAETIQNIKAIQYDIVCNGIELSSGAIRNHRPDMMKKAHLHLPVTTAVADARPPLCFCRIRTIVS
jgi:aspartyl-tRNA synthetase